MRGQEEHSTADAPKAGGWEPALGPSVRAFLCLLVAEGEGGGGQQATSRVSGCFDRIRTSPSLPRSVVALRAVGREGPARCSRAWQYRGASWLEITVGFWYLIFDPVI